MTLTKPTNPRRPAQHRKRSGKHRRQSQHFIKAYWPYLPMLAIVAASVFLNSWLARPQHGVLGYATDVSAQSLLITTNDRRTASGESALQLNAQLTQAAQAKAADMATRDYWSHTTPDGQQPWSFIVAAGYNYQTAGENLAYGFDTAAGTITGWMNSAEHRANLLNTSFTDVGFGTADVANYQNSGPETIIVAMYAAPKTAPVVAPVTTSNTPNQPAAKPAAAVPIATQTPAPVSTGASTPTAASGSSAARPQMTAVARPTEPATQRIARIQLMSSRQATPWSLAAITLISTVVLVFLVLRHGLAWRKVLLRGERFVLHHPLLDVLGALVITSGVTLTQTVGLIR